jgi:hypothetical protein
MPAITLIILFYLVLPAISGYATHLNDHPQKKEKYKAITKFGILELSLTIFVLAMTAVSIAITMEYIADIKIPKQYGRALLGIAGISSAFYIISFFKIVNFIKTHKTLFKYISGILILIAATYSKIYSDMAIAELTGIPPQELPGAQNFLTFIIQPVVFAMYGSITLGYTSIIIAMILFLKIMYQGYKSRNNPSASTTENLDLGAIISVITGTMIAIAFTSEILKKDFYEPNLKKFIVFSSFHLEPSICGLTLPKGSKISIMKYKRAAFAVPDEKTGFTFGILDCNMQSNAEYLPK